MEINAAFPLQPNNMRSCELNPGALKDHVLLIGLSLAHQKVFFLSLFFGAGDQKVFFFKGLMFQLTVLMPQDVKMHILSHDVIWINTVLSVLHQQPTPCPLTLCTTQLTADRGGILQLNHIWLVTVLWVPQIHIAKKTDKLSSDQHAHTPTQTQSKKML